MGSCWPTSSSPVVPKQSPSWYGRLGLPLAHCSSARDATSLAGLALLIVSRSGPHPAHGMWRHPSCFSGYACRWWHLELGADLWVRGLIGSSFPLPLDQP